MSSFDISQYTIEVSMENDSNTPEEVISITDEEEETTSIKEVLLVEEAAPKADDSVIALQKEPASEAGEIILVEKETTSISSSVIYSQNDTASEHESKKDYVMTVEDGIVSITIENPSLKSEDKAVRELSVAWTTETELTKSSPPVETSSLYPKLEEVSSIQNNDLCANVEGKCIIAEDAAKDEEERESIKGEIVSLEEEAISLPEDSVSVRTFSIPDSSEDHEPWNRWLFVQLKHILESKADRIAIVEEIGETRCISYGELMDGVMKAANYLRHHDVTEGTVVGFCLETCFEFILYELACFFLGALPVLLHPSHIASDRVTRLNVKIMVVDADHYGHVLRAFQYFGNLEKVFILADDLTTIYIPKNVWIYDGLGFLDFNCDLHLQLGKSSSNVIAFATSGTSNSKGKIVAHTSQSCKAICTHYYTELASLLKDKNPEECSNVHLVSTSLHTIDGFSYSIYSLIHGGTLLLTETNADVWKVSFLDRVAGLVERYRIPMLMVHSQFLKCFSKYEIHKIYNVESLKLLCHSGSCLPPAIVQHVRDLGMSITQETGAFSVDEVTKTKEMIPTCGEPFLGNSVKIFELNSDEEVAPGKWGRLWVQGPTLFSEYLCEAKFAESCSGGWFFTGDFGSLDEQARLYVAGPIDSLAQGANEIVPLVKAEGILAEFTSIDDVAICNTKEELVAGIVLSEGKIPPSVDEVNKALNGNGIKLKIDRIVVVDFIPRSETGKLLRSDLPFLFETEPEIDPDVDPETEVDIDIGHEENESSL